MVYHLELIISYCDVSIFVNGFPVQTYDGTHPGSISIPINGFLAKGTNEVLVVNRLDDLLATPVNKPKIFATIKQYDNNDITGPEKGEVLFKAESLDNPNLVFNFPFDKIDFTHRLLTSPKLEDEKMIRNYGIFLLKLLKDKNIEDLFKQFKVKLDDLAFSYGLEPNQLYDEWRYFITEKYYNNKPYLDLTENDIFIRPWCDKRIWEVGIAHMFEGLIFTDLNDDGIYCKLKVYVGMVDNRLMVIR
jgi:hypothetical protein